MSATKAVGPRQAKRVRFEVEHLAAFVAMLSQDVDRSDLAAAQEKLAEIEQGAADLRTYLAGISGASSDA